MSKLTKLLEAEQHGYIQICMKYAAATQDSPEKADLEIQKKDSLERINALMKDEGQSNNDEGLGGDNPTERKIQHYYAVVARQKKDREPGNNNNNNNSKKPGTK